MRWFRSGLFCIAACLGLAACSDDAPARKVRKDPEKPAVRLTLTPMHPLQPGKPVEVLAKLLDLRTVTAITEEQLDTVHTQKFHLLLIDPSFTDYQHIHPQPTQTPGLFRFTFTPKAGANYRAWADITMTGKQYYASDDFGYPRGGMMQKVESTKAELAGYRFSLSFDKPPVLGESFFAHLMVTDKKGAAITDFEPVMGARAHVVGFYDDFRTVEHLHAHHTAAGLGFEFTPKNAGFIKIYAQLKIGGREFFVPFGLMIRAS